MKKLFTLLLGAGYLCTAAQTIVTTPNISGTWTLAGSPYIIQTDVEIGSNDVLTIQPGVVVRFQAQTRMLIDGQLIASGTSLSPITFTADDTTQWANNTTTAGGWWGLHYNRYLGPGTDQSIMNYCNISYTKYGYSSWIPNTGALSCERALKIVNCTFKRNRNTGNNVNNSGDAPLKIYTWASTDTVEINNCTVTDNYSYTGIIYNINAMGGYTRILKSNFYNNHLGSVIMSIDHRLLIEGNQIHNNTMQGDNATIKLSVGSASIRNNKIHHNECDQLAAIGCRSGKITIEGNLICNNRQNDPNCGMLSGGGGIHISHNEGAASFYDTYYIVRNNVIANNYSAYGGGGIYVYNAKATISNNHIVNNFTSYYRGQGIMVASLNSEVRIKNNLFHSQASPSNVDTTESIYVFGAGNMEIDYNYLPAPIHKSVSINQSFSWQGDTVHNVFGTNPGMISPTADNNINTDAVSANFGLIYSSPCINEGDTVNAYAALLDYAGSNRIVGMIDIGAYEYHQVIDGNLSVENNASIALGVYPNPVQTYGSFILHTSGAGGKLTIQNVTGSIVKQQEVYSDKTWVMLDGFAPGIYIVSYYGKYNGSAKLIVRD